MKLPQAIEGIHREGRTDCLVSAGVEPAWLGSAWKWAKGKLGGIVKTGACMACDAIPNDMAKAACKSIAC